MQREPLLSWGSGQCGGAAEPQAGWQRAGTTHDEEVELEEAALSAAVQHAVDELHGAWGGQDS